MNIPIDKNSFEFFFIFSFRLHHFVFLSLSISKHTFKSKFPLNLTFLNKFISESSVLEFLIFPFICSCLLNSIFFFFSTSSKSISHNSLACHYGAIIKVSKLFTVCDHVLFEHTYLSYCWIVFQFDRCKVLYFRKERNYVLVITDQVTC